jgi:hypothetical protein
MHGPMTLIQLNGAWVWVWWCERSFLFIDYGAGAGSGRGGVRIIKGGAWDIILKGSDGSRE